MLIMDKEGVRREATFEEEADFLASIPSELPSTPLLKSRLFGAELLHIEAGVISNFGDAITWGIVADVGDYYLGFSEDFPDANYSYAVFANGYRASVPSMDRTAGYLRVLITDPANGNAPVDPPEISIQIFCKG